MPPRRIPKIMILLCKFYNAVNRASELGSEVAVAAVLPAIYAPLTITGPPFLRIVRPFIRGWTSEPAWRGS